MKVEGVSPLLSITPDIKTRMRNLLEAQIQDRGQLVARLACHLRTSTDYLLGCTKHAGIPASILERTMTMINDTTNTLIPSAAPLNGIAGSMASIDRHTLATIEITKATQHLQRRFAFLLGLGYLLVPVLGAFLAWQGYSLHRQNQELHAQTRAIVQSNQTLIVELLGRTSPR